MFMVVAPSSIAICSTSAVNSSSERVASIGENSTSSVYCLEWATAARAWPLTSSRVVWSWYLMWMSLVEMNVWMRGRSESRTAFQAASMSWKPVRARPQSTGPSTWRATAWTASKSPGEAIGKPASITSTPSRASWCAISSFSCLLSEIPGDCSPSRSVVSKIFTRFCSVRSMSFLRGESSVHIQECGREADSPGREQASATRLERQHDLSDVPALVHVAVRLGAVVEPELPGDDRSQASVVDPSLKRLDQVPERAELVPEREHVEADHG